MLREVKFTVFLLAAVIFTPLWSEEQGGSANAPLMGVFTLREQARQLEEDAEKLDDMADRFEDTADELEERQEELEDLARERGDEALLSQAREVGRELNDLQKKIRVMRELEAEKELAARRLAQRADSLELALDHRPLQMRRPFQLSMQFQASSVGPYGDGRPHLLVSAGTGVSYFVTPLMELGIGNIGVTFRSTIYGTRVAVSASPMVALSLFVTEHVQLAVATGARLQCQFGSNRRSSVSGGPFVSVNNQFWINRFLSIGPLLQFNYLARGNYFTESIPLHKAKVLPEHAAWLEGGLALGFHF